MEIEDITEKSEYLLVKCNAILSFFESDHSIPAEDIQNWSLHIARLCETCYQTHSHAAKTGSLGPIRLALLDMEEGLRAYDHLPWREFMT